jgi:hypothetical protein
MYTKNIEKARKQIDRYEGVIEFENGQRKYYRMQITENKSLREKVRKLRIDNSKIYNELAMLKKPIKL